MTEDASFEDGREIPLYLGALDVEDLQVISSLAQDAVFPITEMTWRAGERRFALLINRFRWEDPRRAQHAPERVQSLLVIDNVLGVASQGIDPNDAETVLSLLSIGFAPTGDGAGYLTLVLAGDGAIRLEIEAIEVTLKDVTRPYAAASGRMPRHDI